jgi:hypothetical protein
MNEPILIIIVVDSFWQNIPMTMLSLYKNLY